MTEIEPARRAGRLARLRHATSTADLLAGAGITSLAAGFFLAWPPAGFIVLGLALLLIARFGTEA